MNDTIHIQRDRLTAGVLQFVRSSCLAHCTEINEAEGAVAVTSSWPVAAFSSGEQAAWALLRSLVQGELRRIVEKADADTLGALVGGLAVIHGGLVLA